MVKPPSYPEEAPVGDPVGQMNSLPPSEPEPEATRTRKIVTGAAIGIGSAALVAALLYANRSRKSGSKKPSMAGKGDLPRSAED